jgi:teichuronic acid biosynthesis protein TuaE
MIQLIVNYVTRIDEIKTLYKLWFGTFALMILIGLWELATGEHLSVSAMGNPLLNPYKLNMPTAFNGNPNDLATLITLGIPFVFVVIWHSKNIWIRLLGFALSLAGLYVLFYTSSRANEVGVLLELAFWFFFLSRRRQKVQVVIGIVGISFILFWLFPKQITVVTDLLKIDYSSLLPSFAQGSDRMNLINNAVDFLIRSFGFGVGAGNARFYMFSYEAIFTYGTADLHNWWIEILTNYGIFIFVGYVLMYGALLLRLWRAHAFLADDSLKMSCEALVMGLIGFLIGCISPSSIMDLVGPWMFFGYAIAFLNVYRLCNAKAAPRTSGRSTAIPSVVDG